MSDVSKLREALYDCVDLLESAELKSMRIKGRSDLIKKARKALNKDYGSSQKFVHGVLVSDDI